MIFVLLYARSFPGFGKQGRGAFFAHLSAFKYIYIYILINGLVLHARAARLPLNVSFRNYGLKIKKNVLNLKFDLFKFRLVEFTHSRFLFLNLKIGA